MRGKRVKGESTRISRIKREDLKKGYLPPSESLDDRLSFYGTIFLLSIDAAIKGSNGMADGL